MSIENLPDDLLLESYQQAQKLKLDPAFIELLQKEIKGRALNDSSPSQEFSS